MSKKIDPTLKKCEELIGRLNELKKALAVTHAQSGRTPVNSLGAGWSMDPSTGAFHHSTHGVISTTKRPDGSFHIVHGGRSVGRAKDINEAGAQIKRYVSTLKPHDTGMHNIDPMSVGKSEKKYTPAQLAAIEEAKRLKKSAETSSWVKHSSVPNADDELQRLAKTNPVKKNEDVMATQLANLMQGKAMLGSPPRQPTDEELFGHLVVSEEVAKSAETQWNGAINNWLVEASKPISSRFSSPEEEQAYWDSIKVVDRDDGTSGY